MDGIFLFYFSYINYCNIIYGVFCIQAQNQVEFIRIIQRINFVCNKICSYMNSELWHTIVTQPPAVTAAYGRLNENADATATTEETTARLNITHYAAVCGCQCV